MDIGLILVACAVSTAFIVLWFVRRVQRRQLHNQIHYYRLFAHQVSAMRERTDMPAPVVKFIEDLVKIPVDSAFMRVGVHRALVQRQMMHDDGIKQQVLGFKIALRKLDEDGQHALQNMLISFIMAQSYASLFYGVIYRRLLVKALERDTAAEVAVEAISRHHYKSDFAAA